MLGDLLDENISRHAPPRNARGSCWYRQDTDRNRSTQLLRPDIYDALNYQLQFLHHQCCVAEHNGITSGQENGTNFGPPGQAKLVYFIDDINLPEVDKYNTQSAIALLRQHLEYEHVYDLAKLTSKNISNTQLDIVHEPHSGIF